MASSLRIATNQNVVLVSPERCNRQELILQPKQPTKLQKKQWEGVYFRVYGTAFPMPIQQKLLPPVLLFSAFAGWEAAEFGIFSRFEVCVFFGSRVNTEIHIIEHSLCCV